MFKPGDKVEIECPNFGVGKFKGIVHHKNLTENLVSVHLSEPLQGVYDFAPEFLEKIND